MLQAHRMDSTSSNRSSDHKYRFYPKASWDSVLPVFELQTYMAWIVIFCVALTCGIFSYDGDFVFDDSEAIIGNKDVTGGKPIIDIFFNDFWGNKLASNTSHKSYRPFTVLTFRLNYFLAGGLHPRSFHVVNIILHGVVSTIFFSVFSILLSCDAKKEISFQSSSGFVDCAQSSSSKGALLCGLMFAAHPVHTESISGIVGRADLLCAIFFLVSLLCYARSCQYTYHSLQGCGIWLMLSMLLTCTAVLFKEQGIMVLAICSVYDIFLVHQIDIGGHLKGYFSKQQPTVDNNNTVKKKWESVSWKPLAARHAALTVTGLSILATRWRLMGSAVPVFQVVDNPHSFVNGSFYRALNYNYLYAVNSWILLNPQWLCFDWSMGCIPVITMVSDPRNLATLIFVMILAGLLYRLVFSAPSLMKRQLVMAVSLLTLPFLPASNILFRVGFVIAERNLYLSCAGFSMLVIIGLVKLCYCTQFRKILGYCFYLLLGTYILRSMQRCVDWNTEVQLFEAGEKICPLNAKVHYNIAKVKADLGHVPHAVHKYREAIRLHPEYDQAMNNLANILKDQGDLQEAEMFLTKAVTIRPDFAAAWMNLGITEAALNKPFQAEQSYYKALLHRKNYPDCYYNLGNLYLELKRHNEALSAWRNATLQKPSHVSAWGNMVILLDNLGRLSDLDIVMKEASQHNPREASLYYNYANALGRAGQYKDSERNFLKAIEVGGNSATYSSNLGVLYHRWGKYVAAEKAYMDALKLDPHNTQTQNHLTMLREKMKKGV